MKDFLDQPFEVGRTIIYPGRHGSNLYMNKGRIIQVTENYLKVEKDCEKYIWKTRSYVPYLKVVTLTRTDLVTQI